jgi:RecA-family ATPase
MPRLADGGLAHIQSWLGELEHPRLAVIDTLAMIRSPKGKEQTQYDADYHAVKQLREIANQRGIAIVLVHHLRKQEADDAFDTISGTLGLTAAPDTIMVIKRDTTGTTLHAKGRDLIEVEKAVQFNKDSCVWTILGDANEVRRSNERTTILQALAEAESNPLGPNEIAAACGMKSGNVRRLLGKLKTDGLVTSPHYGKYALRRTP